MRQRASLCRAIVHKHEVLIMDEPFGALDALTREDLWRTMRDLRAKEPLIDVLITHDPPESVFLGDHVIVRLGRPARVLPVGLPADRTIDVLPQARGGGDAGARPCGLGRAGRGETRLRMRPQPMARSAGTARARGSSADP